MSISFRTFITSVSAALNLRALSPLPAAVFVSLVVAQPIWGAPGVFVDSQHLGAGFENIGAAIGDFDDDGDLDIYSANYAITRQNTVWLNDGAGSFIDSGQRLGSSASRVARSGDFDNDGDLDVFVGNGLEQPDRVWLNNGSGFFSDSGQTLANVHTTDVEIGDLDGDGELDAFIASGSKPGWGNPANLVFFGTGTGGFINSGQQLGNSMSNAAAVGDVDGDGDLDVLVANQGADRVWMNDGNGQFTDSGQILSTAISTGVEFGDLDGDGDLDAYVTSSSGDSVWLNANGTFTDSGQLLLSGTGSGYGIDVKLADIDCDNDLDAFVAVVDWSGTSRANRVWWNDGHAVFADSGMRLGDSQSFRVSLADLNGDGFADAFVSGFNRPNDTVWLYDPPGTSVCFTGEFERFAGTMASDGSPGGTVTYAFDDVTDTFSIMSDFWNHSKKFSGIEDVKVIAYTVAGERPVLVAEFFKRNGSSTERVVTTDARGRYMDSGWRNDIYDLGELLDMGYIVSGKACKFFGDNANPGLGCDTEAEYSFDDGTDKLTVDGEDSQGRAISDTAGISGILDIDVNAFGIAGDRGVALITVEKSSGTTERAMTLNLRGRWSNGILNFTGYTPAE